MNKTVFVITFFLFIGAYVFAQLSTPHIISSDMILQHGKNIPIWGNAKPNEKIRVEFGRQTIRTKADKEGNWRVDLKPLAATKTPQKMIIKGEKEVLVYENILVGEVWLCSGQSNMEYRMRLNKNFAKPLVGEDIAEKELEKPANEMIRVFISPRNMVEENSWSVADGNSLANASAPGYFFIKELQEKLDVPVGFITAAVGGTRVETWIPKYAFENSEIFKDEFKRNGRIENIGPSERYEKQIKTIIPFAIKGVIWYQGESNCGISDRRYVEKYKLLVDTWRDLFESDELPFYSVLLAPHIYSDRMHRHTRLPVTAEELAIFREQQIKTVDIIPNTEYVNISDLVDDLKDIHPSYKWEVGWRLAKVALYKDYGMKNIIWSGPRVKEKEIVDNKIVLTFDHVGEGLQTINNKRVTWFEIADESGVYRHAIADIIDGNRVVVYHPEIEKPQKVRFGWHETAMPNLINSMDLPAVQFEK